MNDPLLSVENLAKHYSQRAGLLRREVSRVQAVSDVSFDLERGEILGLVGESGCGKSTTARTILHLEEPTDGTVRFDGTDISTLDTDELTKFRRRAQVVFQDPTSSFDPRMTIGESVAEPLRIHGMRDATRRREIVCDLLERVGLEADDFDRYPHTFSGGQRQRAALARALVVNPDLLVADEPVSALDVSVQAEILELLSDLVSEFDLTVLLITHDMTVVHDVCDRVAAMYLGEIVEKGPTSEVFENPEHPYTKALLDSIPAPNPRDRGRTAGLRGTPPSPSDPPTGCRFHPRCPAVIPPENFDIEQDVWQNLVSLRGDVLDGFSLDSFRETVASDRGETPAEIPPSKLVTALRERHGVPAELSDQAAEAALSNALDQLVAGNENQAQSILAEQFSSPCDQHNPALEKRGQPHAVACHLYSDD